MKTKTMIIFVIFAALALCLSTTQSATAASAEEAVLQVAETWTKAINSGDFKTWSSLWRNAPETTSYAPAYYMAFLFEGYESIVNGMKSIFEMPPGAFIRTHHNPQVTMLNDDVAIMTLYEILTLNPPLMEVQTVYQCRQTLVVQKTGGKWLIVHGHGSFLPVE